MRCSSRPAVLTVLLCVAIGLAHSSGEGEALSQSNEPGVGAEVQSAMKKAAKVVQNQAMAEATKLRVKHEAEIDLDPVAMGIPKEVIEALSDANLVRAVRESLEKLVVPNATDDESVGQKVNAELNGRVMTAAKRALNDPVVMVAQEKAADNLASKEAAKIEAESQMRQAVQANLKGVASKADAVATKEAKGVLVQAQKKAELLASLETTVTDPKSHAKLTQKIERAEHEANEAKKFIKEDKKGKEEKEVAAEVEKIMEEEDKKLKAQLEQKEKAKVKAALAAKAALEAERRLKEKAEEAEQKANEKAEKKTKADRSAFLDKMASVNAQEAGSFSQKIELGSEQGYWTSRRRFKAQKDFVEHGTFDHGEKTPEEQAKEMKRKHAMKAKEEDKEEKDTKAVEAKAVSESLEKSVPAGSVSKMVKKIMQNEAMSISDKLANEGAATVEDAAVDEAVKNVVKQEIQNKNSTKTDSDPDEEDETEEDDESEPKVVSNDLP